tara:strand:- start:489 stop:941 length:453 start_codon:yes stop_codon:yes gene_type:complete
MTEYNKKTSSLYDDDKSQQIKFKKRLYHPSSNSGRCINAQTGVTYPWMSSSFESLRLYKVIDSTGKYDSKGFLRVPSDPINPDANFLYYDSPEQYGRHLRRNVDVEYCSKWHNKINNIFPGGVFCLEAYKNETKTNIGNTLKTEDVSYDD